MAYKYFDKLSASGSGFKNMPNKKLTEELHKSIIRKFEKKGKYIHWGTDLADIQLISEFIKGVRFLLCVINVLLILVNVHGLFLKI